MSVTWQTNIEGNSFFTAATTEMTKEGYRKDPEWLQTQATLAVAVEVGKLVDAMHNNARTGHLIALLDKPGVTADVRRAILEVVYDRLEITVGKTNV